jgi:hypothetical protein
MTTVPAAVIPFPKRVDIEALSTPGACPFQAAAEQRVVILQNLLKVLQRSDNSNFNHAQLRDACQKAREMLSEVVLLYRSSLALAEGEVANQ